MKVRRVMSVIPLVASVAIAPASSEVDDPSSLPTEVLVERALPAIVQIRAKAVDGTNSGSGFIVDSSGVVVTNLHVIRDATSVGIKLMNGETFQDIRIVGVDEQRDLVLLKFAGFDLPPLDLGNSEDVKAGERVIAIGHPSGLENTVTEGIVSSIRVLDSGVKVIQTDAAASPGNSGGPLLNKQGKVIGVVTFGVSEKSLIFAYPINYVRGILALQTQMTLTELAARLAAGGAALFGADSKTGVDGRWLSLKSGTTKTLRTEGDFIYGESTGPDGSTYTYELKKQADATYSGWARHPGSCWYFNPWKGFYGTRVEKFCIFEYEIVFTKVEATRIEGKIANRETPPEVGKKAFREWCDTCGKSVAPTWDEFSWVRAQ
jgi:hypothetical protein